MTFDSKVKFLKCVYINCYTDTFRHKWLIFGTLIIYGSLIATIGQGKMRIVRESDYSPTARFSCSKKIFSWKI